MEMDCLHHLSIKELQEIQKYVQTAVEQKHDSRIQEARKTILNYLQGIFTDAEIIDFLKQLWSEEVYKLEPHNALGFLSDPATAGELLPRETAWHQLDEDFLLTLNKLASYLASRRDEIATKDEAYLLWLMNNGGQKLSKISGEELSKVMADAISKTEEIASSYEHKNRNELELQLQLLSDWFETQTEIPLINTIFAVVATGHRHKSSSPAMDSKPQKSNLLMPLIAQRQ